MAVIAALEESMAQQLIRSLKPSTPRSPSDSASPQALLLEEEESSSKVNSLLDQVEKMVHAGAPPDTPKVKVIRDIVVDQLIPDLRTTRRGSVDQIASNIAAIGECGNTMLAAQQSITSTTEVSVEDVRAKHIACRQGPGGEKKKHEAKTEACTKLDEFLNLVDIPAHIPPQKPRKQMVAYTKTMSQYFCPKLTPMRNMNTGCISATTDYSSSKATCDLAQATFESAFCTWRTQVTDACSALDACYTSALSTHNAFVTATQTLVTKWKSEFAALKKIVCYTDVWLGDNSTKTVNSTQLDRCHSLTVDTSSMDVTYPTIPEKVQCPTTKVDVYPGSKEFETKEYSALGGFASASISCLKSS